MRIDLNADLGEDFGPLATMLNSSVISTTNACGGYSGDPNLALLATPGTQREHAARAANATLGNPPGSTAIEMSLGDLMLHCEEGAITCHSWR